jgi:hypothetical protein
VSLYSPPVKLPSEEEWLLSHCKWAKLFVFPVAHRRELSARACVLGNEGGEGVPPALLAMVTIRQATFGVCSSRSSRRSRGPNEAGSPRQRCRSSPSPVGAPDCRRRGREAASGYRRSPRPGPLSQAVGRNRAAAGNAEAAAGVRSAGEVVRLPEKQSAS